MGCMCSKGVSTNEYAHKHLKKSVKSSTGALRRDEVAMEVDNGATARLISEGNEENVTGSGWVLWDDEETKHVVSEKSDLQLDQSPRKVDIEGNGGMHQPVTSRIISIKYGDDGVQTAGEWPSWLIAVAGEAVKGWLPRRADSFEKMDKIGEGTYSSVYRARDLETGKIVALKKVRFVNMDPESVRFMAREIIVLRRLDHPNVIKLEALVTSRMSNNLYLVFEYMEHDLAGLASSPTIEFTEPQIKCYMQQLLCGLEHCHNNGVLHRDIKGSNLLIDNKGNLKIGDFGLATTFCSNHKQPLTSRVVTLWYRPPELLLGATDYGVAVDLWSAGCILAELFAGKPIMPGRTEVEQMHKIFKLCGSPSEEYWRKSKLPHATIFKPQHPYERCVAKTFKDLPPSALTLLDSLLAVEPNNRGSTSSALQSEFFTTEPLPCDPSSLPQYPPSKEFDAKLQKDEKRRNKAGSAKAFGSESSIKGTRESRGLPAPYAKQGEQRNPQSGNEKYNPEEAGASHLPIEPSTGSLRNGVCNGRLMQPGVPVNMADQSQFGFDFAKQYNYQGSRLSKFSNSVAGRSSLRFDISKGSGYGRYHQLNDAESSHHMLDRSSSSYKKREHAPGKGYGRKKKQMQYSGPLVPPPDGNMKEMAKDHKVQVQHAVRKAHKYTKNENGQRESLLR